MMGYNRSETAGVSVAALEPFAPEETARERPDDFEQRVMAQRGAPELQGFLDFQREDREKRFDDPRPDDCLGQEHLVWPRAPIGSEPSDPPLSTPAFQREFTSQAGRSDLRTKTERRGIRGSRKRSREAMRRGRVEASIELSLVFLLRARARTHETRWPDARSREFSASLDRNEQPQRMIRIYGMWYLSLSRVGAAILVAPVGRGNGSPPANRTVKQISSEHPTRTSHTRPLETESFPT